MKILLAGANGNIGSLVYRKLKNKHSIHSLSKSKGLINSNFSLIDLLDKKSVSIFAQNCINYDILIFFVGLAHKKGRNRELKDFQRINFNTLKNLVEALKDNKKLPRKIIFSSSILFCL